MKIIIQSTEREDGFRVPFIVDQIKKECPETSVLVSATGKSPTLLSSGIDRIVEVYRHDSLLKPVQHFLRILKTHQHLSDDSLLVLQDDIEFTPGMIHWLENEFEWPTNEAGFGCVSLYVDSETALHVSGSYEWIERVFMPDDIEVCNAGACALLLPSGAIIHSGRHKFGLVFNLLFIRRLLIVRYHGRGLVIL